MENSVAAKYELACVKHEVVQERNILMGLVVAGLDLCFACSQAGLDARYDQDDSF